MEDYVRLYENKGLYSLGLRAVEKFISKAEYQEILRMIEQDHFGKNFIRLQSTMILFGISILISGIMKTRKDWDCPFGNRGRKL